MQLDMSLSNRGAHGIASRGADAVRFFMAWLRNPRGIAAIAPSGRALAALITKHVDRSTGPILELGAGTGTFTQALIARGVPEADLTLVETDAHFSQLLRKRFDRATVIDVDAAHLSKLTPAYPHRYGAVICGLGLLNMPTDKVEAIMKGAFLRMRPEAAFHLFTYGRRCSVPLSILTRLGLEAHRVGKAYRNVPPASVYRIVRRTPTER